MANSTSSGVEIVVQLKNSSIDVERAQEDELTSEAQVTQPHKKRRMKMRVPKLLKKELMPPRTTKELKQFFLMRLPILSWLWSYQPKFLIGDITAGITIAIMHISEGLAYAALAELPPIYGLYTSFTAPMIYAVFGTSRHVSPGTLSVASLMVGNAVRRIIDANPSLCISNYPMSTETVNATDVDGMQFDYPDCPASVDIAITITFVYAMFMLLFGMLRLGAVTTFLSEPLISGFLTGVAVHVITSQLRHIMGIPSSAIRVDPGWFELQRTWVKIVTEAVSARLNWATLIIAAICIIFLIVMQVINAQLWRIRYYKKLPIPIPSQLIAVVVATVISTLMQLNDKYDIDILGALPSGLPPVSTPKISFLSDVVADAAFIAIVIFYADMTVENVFAKKHGYTINPNQELFALGIMNTVGSFFSCYISSLALSRSIVQDVTGGKTQAVAFVSSSCLLIVLLAIGPLFEHLPRVVLSSIIIVALRGMFMKAKDIIKYYRLSLPDMFIWIVTFLATVFLGVALGLVVGAGFGILLIVVRTLVPTSMSLGRDNKALCSYSEDGNKIPGVLIFRFIAPFCYTNTQFFVTKLSAACDIDPEKWKNMSLTNNKPGCIEVAFQKLRCHKQYTDNHDKVAQPTIIANAIHQDNLNVPSNSNKNLDEQIASNDKNQIYQHPDLQYIIIDMAPVTFIDSSGSNMLEKVKSDYSSCGIQLVLAATSKHNMKTLEYSGFVCSLGAQWFLPSIQAAVDFIEKQKSLNAQTGNF